MSFEALRKAVADKFIAEWTATEITKVDFGGNQEFTPPVNGVWVRLNINPFLTENAEIGDNFQRTEGLIVVQCFAVKNTGEKELFELVDAATLLFQNQNFDSVRCYATSAIRVGESGNWYQFNASTVFQYDVFS